MTVFIKRVPTEISNFFTLILKKYITSHCFGLNFRQFDTWKDVRPVGNVFTSGGWAITKHYEQQTSFVSNLWSTYSTVTPDILFHNQVLLVIACLTHFSKTEDLKRFLSVWSFEKLCSFVFSLLSGQKEGFDKTLTFHQCRIRQLGKEVSQIQW